MTIGPDLPFRPDPFQVEAARQIDDGRSVVVVAPTGAGKTLIAEHAVARARGSGGRSFYTTPIKALSNQKFADFRQMYGDEEVGLLTGDNVINGEAPIVVMTTEVLRNMIYAGSPALQGLSTVVLDEVHYLQNLYRGSVWEEVIIHLPRGIPLVCLSATIANPEEFTNWIRARRGETALVVETHRPVPLESMYLVKDRFREGAIEMLPVFARGRTNPQVSNLLKKGRGRVRRFAAPRRIEVAETLDQAGLLPAIYFIFSRAGCEQAAERVAGSGIRLTTAAERDEIRSRAQELTQHLPERDLGALGYETWLARLERGVAAHHAGMVPAFKETVEDMFAAGLIKLVFATETLSLGINMPARTVVLERLSKFNGESHEVLKPGDYTQLTGRAGRRGIDTSGTAVVLHNYDIPFERVAAIAAEGSHPLVSSFQPTYNMAANLVANYDQESAEELLNASFAQFRAETRRDSLRGTLEQRQEEAAEFRRQVACERGDVAAFVAEQGEGSISPHRALRDFVQDFRDGDVIRLSKDPKDRAVLLARGWGANPRMVLLATDGSIRRANAEQIGGAIAILGQMELPEPVRTKDGGYRNSVARMLRDWSAEPDFAPIEFRDAATDAGVSGCPDFALHLQMLRRLQRAEKDIRRLQSRLERGEGGLVRQFRALLTLLERWGYVRGWELTEKGQQLRFVYNELDLALAEAVSRGYLDDLTGTELAALTSLFTYEARREGLESEPPSEIVARVDSIEDLARELQDLERAAGVAQTRLPQSGFAAVAYAWAAGHDLEDLSEDDLAAGDFVRNCRQLIDVMRQLRDGFPRLRPAAVDGIKRIDRGVVAAGGRA